MIKNNRCDAPKDQALPLPVKTIDRVHVPKDQVFPLPVTIIDRVLPQFAVMIKNN